MEINYRRAFFAFLMLIIMLFVVSGCSLLGGKRNKVPTIEMIVENPLQIERDDEFIVIKVSDLKDMAPDFSPNAFVILDSSEQEIPYQLDDMDNDGEGDQIAMIMDMGSGEQKKIMIRYAPEGRSVNLGYEKRTRAAIHAEYEGIGWESELIAYRVYPDHRNSISIFGKQEPGLSLDKFAASVRGKGYNHLETWGVNILDGGSSLGCGGFGIWHENKLRKPVNMVEESGLQNGDQVARYTRVAADGPIRSVAQVIYDKWRVGNQTLRVTARYSIFAGQRWTETQIKIEGADNPVKIAAGLTKSDAALLTRNDDSGFFYTWGAQSHRKNPDDLGMALIYPLESFDSFHEDEDLGAYTVILNPGADNEITYWSLAAWSSGELGVKENAEFAKLVSSLVQRLNPLKVTIMPVK